MRFLFVTWDGGGSTPPEFAIARRLVARGHEARFLCDPTLEHDVLAAGCGMTPWTTAPHRTIDGPDGDIIRDYEYSNPLQMIKAYVGGFIGEPAPRWAADTMAELAAHPAHLVLAEFAVPAALIPAEALGLPTVVWCRTSGFFRRRAFRRSAPASHPLAGPLAGSRDGVMRFATRRAFDIATRPINEARRAYGSPPSPTSTSR